MLGRMGAYILTRAAGKAVDTVERHVIWGGIGGLLLTAAFVFLMTASFVWLQNEIGRQAAALALAGACVVLGLISFKIPALMEWSQRQTAQHQSPVEEVKEAVEEEAQAAVDVLGPMRVAASAFLLGFGAARQLKTRNR